MVTLERPRTEWALDSGCSFHMTPNKGWIEDITKIDGGIVLLGNNKQCHVVGAGSMGLKNHLGIEKILTNVRYIHNLKRNLVSLGTLDQEGYMFKYENGILTVSKNEGDVLKGVRRNGLYFLGKTIAGLAASVSKETSS